MRNAKKIENFLFLTEKYNSLKRRGFVKYFWVISMAYAVGALMGLIEDGIVNAEVREFENVPKEPIPTGAFYLHFCIAFATSCMMGLCYLH